MVANTLIEVQEVDEFGGMSAPPAGHQHEEARRGVSLSEIHSRIGPFLLPSYLPDGFELSISWLQHDRVPKILYEGSESVLGILQDGRRAAPKIKAGFVEEVSVGAYPGYLIHGCWNQHSRERDGQLELSPPEWKVEDALALLLERDNRWVQVAALPPNEILDQGQLFKVAEGLLLYTDG